MKFIAPAAVAAVLLLATGYVHGILSGRWGDPEALARGVEHLKQIPSQLSGWTGTDMEIPETQLTIGQIRGYVSRRYEHEDGSQVDVLLLCGRPGPISVHTPDVCFRGAGFQLVQDTEYHLTKGDRTADLVVGDFKKEGAGGASDGIRVFWGWMDPSGTISAPQNPRMAFAGQSCLYKVYVIRPLQQVGEQISEDDQCVRLLNALLPRLSTPQQK
ncbi:MAG: exosortase-associated EpsI family protein [Planctomycetaceae bacterium]|nr:exosortase-associated EpsI family protein [Planctomycetaceae bacterium]